MCTYGRQFKPYNMQSILIEFYLLYTQSICVPPTLEIHWPCTFLTLVLQCSTMLFKVVERVGYTSNSDFNPLGALWNIRCLLFNCILVRLLFREITFYTFNSLKKKTLKYNFKDDFFSSDFIQCCYPTSQTIPIYCFHDAHLSLSHILPSHSYRHSTRTHPSPLILPFLPCSFPSYP